MGGHLIIHTDGNGGIDYGHIPQDDTKIVEELVKKLIADQKDLPVEYSKLINENYLGFSLKPYLSKNQMGGKV